MYYSDELVEEVRQRNDIVDIISGYVNLKKKGGNYFGLCPFHNEKSASFSVSPGKQMYYCFGCGAGGNVFTFIMNYENTPLRKRSSCWQTGRGSHCRRSRIPKRQERRKTAERRFCRSIRKLRLTFIISCVHHRGVWGWII